MSKLKLKMFIAGAICLIVIFKYLLARKGGLNSRAAGTYEDIRTGPHHVFRIQLTLSQPGGGADYAHHSPTVLTMLKYVPAALGSILIL